MPDYPPGQLAYISALARRHTEALGFIPHAGLARACAAGRVLMALEEGAYCGYLLYGAAWPTLRIYQCCIQDDARRLAHGRALVAQLAARAPAQHHGGIALWCATDLESNQFWHALGFRPTAQRAGGQRRGRRHQGWYLPLTTLPQLTLPWEDAPDA